MLLLIHDHFIKPKAEKRKIPFLVTKRSQNWIRHNFLTCHLKLYVVSLLLLSKNRFLRMDEQYGSHPFFNHISAYFLGGCNVFFFNTLWGKVLNEKLQFWVTKRDQKMCMSIFFWTHDQKIRVVWFYNFVSNINHIFQSDVTVLTLFWSEIVWSAYTFMLNAWMQSKKLEVIEKRLTSRYKIIFI